MSEVPKNHKVDQVVEKPVQADRAATGNPESPPTFLSFVDKDRGKALRIAREGFIRQVAGGESTTGPGRGKAAKPLVPPHQETIQSTPNKPVDPETQKPTVPDQRVCAQNPEYIQFIDAAAKQIEDLGSLGDLKVLKNKYNCEIKSFDDAVNYASKALQEATGDPFTFALSPERFRQLTQDSRGNFGGIGAELKGSKLTPDLKPIAEEEKEGPDRDPGPEPTAEEQKKEAQDKTPPHGEAEPEERTATVVGALPGTPAADIQPDDVIAKVCSAGTCVNTVGMPLDKAVSKIRGPVGTPVHLDLIRNGARIERDLKRADIKVDTVSKAEDRGDDIYYIRIKSFGLNTADDLKEEMKRAKDAKAFVIDVRNNPGGLLDTSVQSAELIVKNGRIMTERDREESDPAQPIYSAKQYRVDNRFEYLEGTRPNSLVFDQPLHRVPRYPYLAGGKPIVVLQNRGTASAAEIFTGAAHDTAGATTVGTRSFGKGVIQTVNPFLPRHAGLKVTSGHYETPSGIWPGSGYGPMSPPGSTKGRIGLKPDKEVQNPKGVLFGSPEDLQYQTALEIARERIKASQ